VRDFIKRGCGARLSLIKYFVNKDLECALGCALDKIKPSAVCARASERERESYVCVMPADNEKRPALMRLHGWAVFTDSGH
jgi:hypothetical protein